MLVDSHCHLDFNVLQKDLVSVLKRAFANDVTLLHTISTRISEFDNMHSIALSNDAVLCSVGNHPLNLDKEGIVDARAIIEYTAKDKVVSIGETGLDYYHGSVDKSLQKKSFIEHIMASQETSYPLIVHTRNADEDTFTLLYENYKKKSFKAIMHCFTSSMWLAERCLELGFYISASGIVTFKNAKNVQEVFKKVPLENLLIETDSPYLAPEPMRGKSCEPAYLKHTAKYLAQLLDISYSELAKKTSENFHNLLII